MFDSSAMKRIADALADHNCRDVTFHQDGRVTVAIETWGTVSRYTYSTAEIAEQCIREARAECAEDSEKGMEK